MAITRIWQSGAESGNEYEAPYTYNSTGVSSAEKYTGTYSYNIATNNTSYVLVTPSATRTIRAGCWWIPNGYGRSSQGGIIETRTSSGTRLTAGMMNAGSIHFWLNNTDTANIPLNQGWQHFSMCVYIDNTVGWAYFYVNGIEVYSATNVNTGNADIGQVSWGHRSTDAQTGQVTQYFDDLYVDDITGESAAVPPILRFYPLDPDGNGNYSQWTGSDGDSTDNYLLLDERPPDTDDYIEVASADQYDSQTATSYTLATGETAVAVIPWALVGRAGATEQIALGTRYSSTDSIGSDQEPSTGPTGRWLYERQTTKPGGGAWDQTSLDGFELVQKSRGTY